MNEKNAQVESIQTPDTQIEEYTIPVQVGTRSINVRKWKVKDKREFTNIMKAEKPDDVKLLHALVYNCIDDKKIVLSEDEYKYVLNVIRSHSLGDEVKVGIVCEACETKHEQTYKISELFKQRFSDKTEFTVGPFTFKLTNVKNRDMYYKKMKDLNIPEEIFYYDFLFHIASINGNESLSLKAMEELFDEIDVGTLEKIFEEWDNIRFKLNDVNEVKCTECGHVELYSFDELPEFFPSAWFSKR
jgi:hypothetical protein